MGTSTWCTRIRYRVARTERMWWLRYITNRWSTTFNGLLWQQDLSTWLPHVRRTNMSSFGESCYKISCPSITLCLMSHRSLQFGYWILTKLVVALKYRGSNGIFWVHVLQLLVKMETSCSGKDRLGSHRTSKCPPSDLLDTKPTTSNLRLCKKLILQIFKCSHPCNISSNFCISKPNEIFPIFKKKRVFLCKER